MSSAQKRQTVAVPRKDAGPTIPRGDIGSTEHAQASTTGATDHYALAPSEKKRRWSALSAATGTLTCILVQSQACEGALFEVDEGIERARSSCIGVGAEFLPSAGIEFLPREDAPCPPGALLWMLCVWPLRLRWFGVWGWWWVLGCKKWFREGGQLVSTRFEERSRFRLSVMWVLLLSGAACSWARDGASWTLLLVSVEVSEARSSMSTIDVDTVHLDERTISLEVIFVFIIYVRFIGILYYPETPSDPIDL